MFIFYGMALIFAVHVCAGIGLFNLNLLYLVSSDVTCFIVLCCTSCIYFIVFYHLYTVSVYQTTPGLRVIKGKPTYGITKELATCASFVLELKPF